jgi:hypothetical protein
VRRIPAGSRGRAAGAVDAIVWKVSEGVRGGVKRRSKDFIFEETHHTAHTAHTRGGARECAEQKLSLHNTQNNKPSIPGNI